MKLLSGTILTVILLYLFVLAINTISVFLIGVTLIGVGSTSFSLGLLLTTAFSVFALFSIYLPIHLIFWLILGLVLRQRIRTRNLSTKSKEDLSAQDAKFIAISVIIAFLAIIIGPTLYFLGF